MSIATRAHSPTWHSNAVGECFGKKQGSPRRFALSDRREGLVSFRLPRQSFRHRGPRPRHCLGAGAARDGEIGHAISGESRGTVCRSRGRGAVSSGVRYRALSTVTQEKLTMIENGLNHQLRRRLGFKNPYVLFHASLKRVVVRT